MARIRTIKPEFWTDEKIVEMSAFARLLFLGLLNFVDDYGRAVYSPSRFKLQILPADPVDISELFEEIRGKTLIQIYTVDGVDYLHVKGFEKHQKVDKRTPSKLPAPPITPNSPEPSREIAQEGKGKEGSRGEGKVKEKKSASLREAHSPDGDAPEKALNGDLKEESPIEAPPDAESARKILFTEGLKTLVDLSGRRELACRAILGGFLKAADDDAGKVLAAIRAAQEQPPPLADPVAWITAAVQQRAETRGSMPLIRAALAERAAKAEAAAGEAA